MAPIRLNLTTMAHGGEGLGRHEGKVIFVPYAIPGEEVLVEVSQDRDRYARAHLREVLVSSPLRVEPGCRHFGSQGCGGCQWQHIAYQGQLQFKRQVLADQLTRIAALEEVPVKPTIGMDDPWGYRNNVQFHFDREGDLGFWAADGRGVVAIEECPIMAPLLEEMWTSLDLTFPQLKRLTLRAGLTTGEQMVVLETEEDAAPAVAVDSPISCVLLLADGTPVSLVGQTHISEEVGGRRFRISARSFFQVNTLQMERLVEVVGHYLAPTGTEVLLDAYCGVGTFGLLFANRVKEVIGVEENRDSVADARHNAEDLPNVRFVEGPVEEILPQLGTPLDLAILDPPRQGCQPAALEALVNLAPHRIVYVSCDPATLARDIKRLGQGGYRLSVVQPLDMFPQTYHIESVALLEL
ncbi:MAG: 23S rRNA (uracil(1939)-C(5))-methyltransferase RlmD [Anaerolineae bacterium]